MDIQQKLQALENDRNLIGALHFLYDEQVKDADTYLRVIFLLIDFLVDKQYSTEKHDFYAAEVANIYSEAKARHSDDCDFLFFSSMMIYIADVYFNETTEDAANKIAKVCELCPDNVVYQWGLYSFIDNRANIQTKIKFDLSEQILNEESPLASIRNKGLLGFYLMGRIEATYNETQKLINKQN